MKTPQSVLVSLCLVFASAHLSAQTPAPSAAPSSSPDEGKNTIALDIFSVKAKRDQGAYGASTALGATRMNTPIREIPQTVNILTSDFLVDTYSFDLEDALRYVPDITQRKNNDQPTTLIVRGFLQQNGGAYINSFHVFETKFDRANVERVEIIKGPASAIVGRGEQAGAVNYVTKAPLLNQQTTLEATVGSDNFYRVVADSTGPLNASKSLRYRAIALYQDTQTWRPFEQKRKIGFYPSLDWQITKSTLFRFTGMMMKNRTPANANVNMFSTTGFAELPQGTYLLSPRHYTPAEPYDRRIDRMLFGQAQLIHNFTDHIIFRASVQAGNYNDFEEWVIGGSNLSRDAKTGDLLQSRTYRYINVWQDDLSAQGDLVAKYNALWGKHTTLFGYEVNKDYSKTLWLQSALAAINYSHPVYTNVRPATAPKTNNSQDTWTEKEGVFVQHQSSFVNDRITLMAGIRYDRQRGLSHSTLKADQPWVLGPFSRYYASPRYGVTVAPVNWLSLYAARSVDKIAPFTISHYASLPASDPRSSETLSGMPTGQLDETGIKGELFGGRMSITFSWFKTVLTDQKIAIPRLMPNGQGYNEWILSTGSYARGIELQTFGKLTRRLDAMISYSKIKATNMTATGLMYLYGVPDNHFSFFLNQRFYDEGKSGFSVRAGFVRTGAQWGTTDSQFKFGPQKRADVGASYIRARYKYSIQVNNVFDAYYMNTAGGEAPPRQIFCTVGVRY